MNCVADRRTSHTGLLQTVLPQALFPGPRPSHDVCCRVVPSIEGAGWAPLTGNLGVSYLKSSDPGAKVLAADKDSAAALRERRRRRLRRTQCRRSTSATAAAPKRSPGSRPLPFSRNRSRASTPFSGAPPHHLAVPIAASRPRQSISAPATPPTTCARLRHRPAAVTSLLGDAGSPRLRSSRRSLCLSRGSKATSCWSTPTRPWSRSSRASQARGVL